MNIEKLNEIVNGADYTPQMGIAGYNFRVGCVDRLPLWMSLTVEDVIFSDGTHSPCIFLSRRDLRSIIETETEETAIAFLTFILGHEIGHVLEFATIDRSKIVDGLICDEELESRCDRSGIALAGITPEMYGSMMQTIRRNLVNFDLPGGIIGKVASMLRKNIIDHRVRRTRDLVAKSPVHFSEDDRLMVISIATGLVVGLKRLGK